MGFFAVAGSSLYVGRHSGEPLSGDYPGDPPYAFSGGTLRQVTVDVSGESITEFEHHAGMLFKHQ
jgi:arylsulfatase